MQDKTIHRRTWLCYYEQEIVNAVKTVAGSHIAIILDLKKLSATIKKASRQSASTAIVSAEGLAPEIEQLQASKRQLYERYKKGFLDKATYLKERKAVENKISDRIANCTCL